MKSTDFSSVTQPTERLLTEEENIVAHSYKDSEGYDTIGVGHLIDERRGGGLPDDIIKALLAYDINVARSWLTNHPRFLMLNPVQQAALVSMVFQLGTEGASQFHSMWALLAFGNIESAAKAGLESTWAKQTPERAQREMEMLSTGLWVPRRS